jgi:hypothetical protein
MTEPADLASALAALAAAFPVTSARAAANALLLDSETAAFEKDHPDWCAGPLRNEPVRTS